MTNKSSSLIEIDYRAFYGKLFSALINQFGVNYIVEIEDAIQNTFLKSLKNWNVKQPINKENWLFIVAKNDVINQLKGANKTSLSYFVKDEQTVTIDDDLRLQTILLTSCSKKISTQTKIVFILKNIFGLHIREIEESTFIKQDAIYKSIKRAYKNLKVEFEKEEFNSILNRITKQEIHIVEQILYAVFNVGFDSFNEKSDSIVNDDICLEALSLTKLLYKEKKLTSTRNLLALFCFHLARIPSKINNGKLISFLKQDRNSWNKDLIDLGFHYLKKPKKLNKFYLETLLVSKYMTTDNYSVSFWLEIVNLYELLIKISNSPIIKLNYCYVLHKAEKNTDSLKLLNTIENELPNNHIYFSLVKAEIIRQANPKKSEEIITSVLTNIHQNIRKDYLLENSFINY